MTVTARLAAWLASALFVLATAFAHAGEPRLPNSIEVTGDAQADAAADLALLDFGVVTQAETAAAAARENARRMEAVLAAARKAAGADARIGTGTYSIRAVYAQQREPQGSPRITGYEARNVVHLRMRALARVGEVIDAAVGAGANQVQRLVFTLSDDSAPRREALKSAVAKALDKAQTIAGALGAKAGPVHSVVEHDTQVQPLARQAFAMQAEGGVPTPIEPGQVEVRARVVLTVPIVR